MQFQKVSLESINDKLLHLNSEYEKKFNSPTSYRSEQLSKKQYSLIYQEIYAYVESGHTEAKQTNKQVFLKLARTYLKNFIHSHIVLPLDRSKEHSATSFEETLSRRWEDFKIFTFFYYAVLQSCHEYFQNACLRQVSNGAKMERIESQTSVYPIPVIALNCFKSMVLDPYCERIRHSVLAQIDMLRNKKKINEEALKNLIELMWCCGLGELARVKIQKSEQKVRFYKDQRQNFLKLFKFSQSTEHFFEARLLSAILEDTNSFYTKLHSAQLLKESPAQQIESIRTVIRFEDQFCDFYFLNNHQKRVYFEVIYRIILLNDFEALLKRQNGVKDMLQALPLVASESFGPLMTFFQILKDVIHLGDVIKGLENVFADVILHKGEHINKKIAKRKEYILDMIRLKRSVQDVIVHAANRNFRLVAVADQSFKKILDSIEASKNLAEFADFTIKQCLKLKLDEDSCYEKFSDIFLLLSSVSSTDSFSLYYQEFMAKRLIDVLNEPKTQIESQLLKKLSEKLGVVAVASHFAMVKDIENSIEMTEKYSSRLPFSSFKWNLKVYNSSHWPEYLSKSKLSFELPNQILHQAKAIQELYHDQNQYRFLNWKLEKGVSLFEGKFASGKFRFQSQNSYLMILLIIQEQENKGLFFGNLRSLVRSSKEEESSQAKQKYDSLSLILHVLIENRLLVRSDQTVSAQNKYSPFGEGEEVRVNQNYTPPPNCKPGQISIIRPSQELSKSIQQSSIEKNKILKDREKLIEAVLVRGLKHAHSTMGNSVTFAELYQAIRKHKMLGAFNFSEGVVKQRLEELIARDYCERDEDDRRVYHYIA